MGSLSYKAVRDWVFTCGIGAFCSVGVVGGGKYRSAIWVIEGSDRTKGICCGKAICSLSRKR
jgi:hypothetical protein